jgi:hypothetical protein
MPRADPRGCRLPHQVTIRGIPMSFDLEMPRSPPCFSEKTPSVLFAQFLLQSLILLTVTMMDGIAGRVGLVFAGRATSPALVFVDD